jgi:hypothetical protein
MERDKPWEAGTAKNISGQEDRRMLQRYRKPKKEGTPTAA